MDFTYNEKTVMSSGGFIPSTNDTPLDARGRVNLYSEIKDIPNPYVGMEIRVLQDETNEGKMTKYKVTKLLPNEFGVPNSYIDTDTLEKISESLSDEDLVFDGICEDELGVITPQLKTDYNLTTTDKTIVGAINELKEALANITIGDNGEAVNLPFNSIDKGLASSNIDFSEIKNGNYCYIIRGTIGYDIPDGNLPLNNDMVHITKSNTAMTIITLSGGIYTYNGGTNGTDYISCTKDNFMTYSVASETYQLKNDSKLITTDKTVVGAINELKNALDSGVNGVSTILTVSPTYEELDTLPEGSKVYILNGLGYNGDPVHINKSSNTITLISIDGVINKYQKVGNSWSNYSTENWATQKYVDTAIANAQLGGESGSVDLSEYQKITDSSLATTNKNIVGAINEVKSSVDGITVPTKTSDLTNDSGFITSIPSEYITETELETKGYLTEHQSLTDYAKKIDIPDVSDFLTEVPAGYVTDTKLSTELDKKVNKEVGKGLSTNDLTNELITKINSSATEAFVTNAIANAQLGSGEVDLSGYATVDALNLKADLTHTHDQYLTKVPDEYITETELNAKGYLTEHQDISNLALKSEIPDVSSFITSDDLPTVPTKVSDLANDKNYISSIPSEYVTETELTAKGYLTSHQDISNLQPKTDNSLTTTDKTVIGAINELKTNMSNINTGGGSSFSGSYNDLTDKPTIPTKTSDLNNDSGFIGYPDVIVIDKGSMDAEVDLDNDIPLGRNTILLTGRVVYNTYGHELVFVYRDRESSDSFIIYTMKGDKVVVSKSNGNWSITSNTSFIYRDNANSLYQKITDNTLTTTAKTIPTAINELKSGLNGIKVPTKTSELTNNSGFITTIPDEYITETELNAKGYLTSHQDISGLQTKTDNNLATTSKEVVGAINEVKSSNDTKLNKTDANKLNCVTIDNVSLKEYILTNCTETGKTYYLLANTTCTDLPKASNFFITVETPGSYTYKVTAKELNDSNGTYICTYRTVSSSWTAWEKVCTTKIADVDVTDISMNTNYTTGANCKYQVVNGICFIDFIGGYYKLSDTVNNVILATGLPIPRTGAVYTAYVPWGSKDASKQVLLLVNQNGELALHAPVESNACTMFCSFSYPVAES